MYQDDLAKLSRDELIALALAHSAQIEAQTTQIAALLQRIAELEAKLGQPPKTPDNSSLPPSQGRKANPVVAAGPRMCSDPLAPCLRRGKLLRKISTVCGVSCTSTALRAKQCGTL